jgi:hypothetical protein
MENEIQPTIQPQTSVQPISPKPKFSFKSKWPLAILAAIIILSLPLGGFLLLGKLGIHPKSSTVTIRTSTPTITQTNRLLGKVFWDIPDTSLSTSEKEIKNAFTIYDPSLKSTNFNDNRILAIEKIQLSSVSADFALADTFLKEKNGNFIATDGDLYYLHKENGVWKIRHADDPEINFCAFVKNFPSDLLDENLKAYLVSCFPKE